jgi:hypothetical protein
MLYPLKKSIHADAQLIFLLRLHNTDASLKHISTPIHPTVMSIFDRLIQRILTLHNRTTDLDLSHSYPSCKLSWSPQRMSISSMCSFPSKAGTRGATGRAPACWTSRTVSISRTYACAHPPELARLTKQLAENYTHHTEPRNVRCTVYLSAQEATPISRSSTWAESKSRKPLEISSS